MAKGRPRVVTTFDAHFGADFGAAISSQIQG
eukprot:COSAG01_NODE_27448_length_685_cov_1.919795_1_plen_30_part_10